jgi:hypothetical protein
MSDEVVPVGTQADPFVDDWLKRSILRHFNIRPEDEKRHQSQIERIVQWAKAKGAKDDADAMWSIKQLANRVGSPKIGNNWVQHLGQYAYLDMERMKLDKEIGEYSPSKEEHG